MPAIGITGGISTGKSSFCECLREMLPGAKFFNADEAAHRLVDLDSEVKKEIRSEFGEACLFGRRGLEPSETSSHSIREREQKRRA